MVEIDPSRSSSISSSRSKGLSSLYSSWAKANSDFHSSKPLIDVRSDSTTGSTSGFSSSTHREVSSSLSFSVSPRWDPVRVRSRSLANASVSLFSFQSLILQRGDVVMFSPTFPSPSMVFARGLSGALSALWTFLKSTIEADLWLFFFCFAISIYN